jgi:Putative Ig domain
MRNAVAPVKLIALLAALSLVAACGGGGQPAGAAGDVAAAPSPAGPGGALGTPSNGQVSTAPTISGQPRTKLRVAEAYTFQPTASDADGDHLTFTIANTPSWARFDVSTGKLSGTPTATDVGSYPAIAIAVSDGAHKATLQPFTLVVSQIGAGSASLSWLPPTQNSDGSTLIDLAGYQIYFGRDPANLNEKIQVNNASITTYLVSNLSPGVWYFGVSARNSRGAESNLAGPVSGSIG